LSNRAFGSINHGPTVASGATLELTALVTMPNPLTLAGGTLASVTGVNPGTNTWMGPVTLTADSFISADASSTLLVGGAISGNVALNKVGPGPAVLQGSSPSFTGLTSMQGGTLKVGFMPNSNVSVTASTLGTGTIGSLVASGGTVRPGFLL